MQLDFSSIKGFFWAFVRILYSLIPASFFLFVSCLYINTFQSHFPETLQTITKKITCLDSSFSIMLFVLTAFVLTFINDAVSGIILWDENYNGKDDKEKKTDDENKKEKKTDDENKKEKKTDDENKKENKQESPTKKYKLELDNQITAEEIGISNLVGVKIIEEYENLNTWTFLTMAHKDVLLGIYNYTNIFLFLFLPFSLCVKYSLPQWEFIMLLFVQALIFIAVFFSIRYAISQFSTSKNWKDKTITKTLHIGILSLFPLIGVLLLLVPILFPGCFFKPFAILLSINFFLSPVKLFMVLTAHNFHNRVRRMVDSAFFQIRFNDILFRGNKKETKGTQE
jgi:hypothetical protein